MSLLTLFQRRGLPLSGLVGNWDLYGGSGASCPNSVSGGTALSIASGPTWTAMGLSYDGGNHFVTYPSYPNNTGALSMIFVASRPWTSSGYKNLAAASWGSGSGIGLLTVQAGFDWLDKSVVAEGAGYGTGVAPRAAQQYGAVADGTPHVIGAALSASVARVYFDATHVNSLSKAGAVSTTSSDLYIGFVAGQQWDGMIYHVLMYNRALNDSEMARVRQYLRALWVPRGLALP
jgi:hypothetical protein